MIVFEEKALFQYMQRGEEDRKILKKINTLIKDMLRDPFNGIGKPEPLKYDLSGHWSRRITDEHRLVYKVEAAQIIIASCKYHY